MTELIAQVERTFLGRFGLSLKDVDKRIARFMAANAITMLRVSVGVIFLWFGALKVIPGLSPAEGLIISSLGPVSPIPMAFAVPLIGLWEVVIGLGFITGAFMRLTLMLMFAQMVGTVSPVALNPEAVWNVFPFGLTLEGQYIIKNMVLISAALVVGTTVHGGRIVLDETAK
jgi:uncharacterized membrane protein YkgB